MPNIPQLGRRDQARDSTAAAQEREPREIGIEYVKRSISRVLCSSFARAAYAQLPLRWHCSPKKPRAEILISTIVARSSERPPPQTGGGRSRDIVERLEGENGDRQNGIERERGEREWNGAVQFPLLGTLLRILCPAQRNAPSMAVSVSARNTIYEQTEMSTVRAVLQMSVRWCVCMPNSASLRGLFVCAIVSREEACTKESVRSAN